MKFNMTDELVVKEPQWYAFELTYEFDFNVEDDILEINDNFIDECHDDTETLIISTINKIEDCSNAEIQDFDLVSMKERKIYGTFDYSGSKSVDELLLIVDTALNDIPTRKFSTDLYDGTTTMNYVPYGDRMIPEREFGNESRFKVELDYYFDVKEVYKISDDGERIDELFGLGKKKEKYNHYLGTMMTDSSGRLYTKPLGDEFRKILNNNALNVRVSNRNYHLGHHLYQYEFDATEHDISVIDMQLRRLKYQDKFINNPGAMNYKGEIDADAKDSLSNIFRIVCLQSNIKLKESFGFKSGDRYYGGLPAEPEYNGPGKDARYYKELTKYFRDTALEYHDYDVTGTSRSVVILKTPEGKKRVDLTRFDACADAAEAIEMAQHYFDSDVLFEAKKERKRRYCTLNTNAGDVELNNQIFNAMNNPSESPSTNPVSGPMGEAFQETNKLEAEDTDTASTQSTVNEKILTDMPAGRYEVERFNWSHEEVTVTCYDKEADETFEKWICAGVLDEDTGRRTCLLLLKDPAFVIPVDIKNEMISTFGLDDFGYKIEESLTRSQRYEIYHRLFDKFDDTDHENELFNIHGYFDGASDVIVVNSASKVPNEVDGQRLKYKFSFESYDFFMDPYREIIYIVDN